MNPEQTQQFMHAFLGAYLAFLLIVFIIKVVLYAIPMWRICKRAGLAPQIALLCAIPLVGRLITTYVIAFSDWKTLPPPPAYGGYAPPTTYRPAPTVYPPPPPPAL